jgi:predicted transcriptional regulator
MDSKVLIARHDQILEISKALGSPLRLRMLTVLLEKQLNIQDLARELGILTSSCTMNIQILEKAGLVKTETVPASRGSQKMCKAHFSEVVLPLVDEMEDPDSHLITINMPIGLYTDFEIHPPCGILSEHEIIDYLDSERAFLSPQRSNAQLIWFTDGYIEYSFPVNIPRERKIKSLQISTEICSEFPGYKKEWPSDISLWINAQEIGTWTSPGDMGDKRGRFTPGWWGVENTQFGFLKTWRVTREGSFIDGIASSQVKIDDIHLHDDYRIRVRIGVKKDAAYRGGLNIFGEKFGNHPTGMSLQIELEN